MRFSFAFYVSPESIAAFSSATKNVLLAVAALSSLARLLFFIHS